jgi:hypothetical protein
MNAKATTSTKTKSIIVFVVPIVTGAEAPVTAIYPRYNKRS